MERQKLRMSIKCMSEIGDSKEQAIRYWGVGLRRDVVVHHPEEQILCMY